MSAHEPAESPGEAVQESGSVPSFNALVRLAPVFATILLLTALAGDPAPGDAWMARLVQDVPFGWLPANVALVMARPSIMFVAWCVGALVALRARSWPLVLAALLVLIALAVNPVLKEVIARPRPGAGDLVIRRAADGYGFPSGHTSSATLMYGFSAVVLASIARRKVAYIGLAAASSAIGLIAFERVYDGAHWPSDVAAGFTSGVLLVASCVTLARIATGRIRQYRQAPAQDGN